MLPRTLQARLLLTYLVLTAIGLGGVIFWTGTRLQETSFEEAEHEIELRAHLIANAMRDPLLRENEHAPISGRTVQALAQSYAGQTGGRVAIFDERLQLLAVSDGTPAQSLGADASELAAARSGDDQAVVRRDAASGQARLYTAVRIGDDREHAGGYIQLSEPLDDLYGEISGTWVNLLLSGAVVLLAMAAASIWLARQISRPITHLTAATAAIAAGDLDRRIRPEGPDEIQRLGDSFNRMADRVRDTLEKQRAFVGDAAHELRSPLTSLRLRLEMIRAHGEEDVALRNGYLAAMDREMESLQRLVERLLALSALDQAHSAPRQPLDLAPLLYDAADEVSPLAHDAGVDLSLEVPEHLGHVEANRDEMRIVARNLLDNAIKYTPAGGHIRLSAEAADGRVRIEVRDSGIGIAPEDLPRIFDRFYRIDRARTRRAGGTGLGLSLVQAIVQAHGGEVRAESTVGKGTRLTIELPLCASTPAGEGGTRAPAS